MPSWRAPVSAMRALLVSAAFLAVSLAVAPVADASCHYCFAPGPVGEYLSRLLS